VREKFDLMKQTAELEELYLRAVGAHKEITLTLPSPGLPGEGNEGNSEESLAGVVH